MKGRKSTFSFSLFSFHSLIFITRTDSSMINNAIFSNERDSGDVVPLVEHLRTCNRSKIDRIFKLYCLKLPLSLERSSSTDVFLLRCAKVKVLR